MDETLRTQLCTEILDLLNAWAVAEQKLANEWSGEREAAVPDEYYVLFTDCDDKRKLTRLIGEARGGRHAD